jgi:hypothetical protein
VANTYGEVDLLVLVVPEGVRPHFPHLRVFVPGDLTPGASAVNVANVEVRTMARACVLHRPSGSDPAPDQRFGEGFSIPCRVMAVKALRGHAHPRDMRNQLVALLSHLKLTFPDVDAPGRRPGSQGPRRRTPKVRTAMIIRDRLVMPKPRDDDEVQKTLF